MSDEKVTLFILCSPHNPVGRVWKEEELERIMEICLKHNVFVISDEIHHDLILEGKHIPTAIVAGGKYAQNIITLTAPSKTFNLAGCQNSIAIIENEEVMKKFDKYATTAARVSNGSLFGYVAAEAAYTHGEEWLDGAINTIKGNYHFMVDTLKKELPEIVVSPLQGTYLSWLDLSKYVENEHLEEVVQKKCRLAVDYGEWFGEAGKDLSELTLLLLENMLKKQLIT